MGKLKLAELRDKLGEGDTAFDVYDDDGRVVGRYVPDAEHRRQKMYEAARAKFAGMDFSAVRAEMIANGFQGVSTEEILAAIAAARREREGRS